MNILIPDSWLCNFIETKADTHTIAEKLSLTSFNVEKIHKEGGDFIYEIETTPNRGDALSVLGIAREVYASLKSFRIEAKLKLKDVAATHASPNDKARHAAPLQLDVSLDPNLCPHFAALILDNVEIKPSPKKIQDRLEKVGIRALNNVIDVTNYIMVERGQPMHAFDYEKVADHKMILRESRVGESLVTLDGIKRELPQGSIVIEDGEKIIDLCGIMGGANSAIDDKTKRVILFAQIYDPIRIRKTSMKLGLRTDAAQRFEKGLDPEMVLPALLKAADMLRENANAYTASKLINIRQKEFKPQTVKLTMEKLRTYLGVDIEPKKVAEILGSLGFCKDQPYRKNSLGFEVPSWRSRDITIEEDLIEEIARLYGYYKIPSLLPKGRPPTAVHDRKFEIEKRLKVLLKDLGFTEVYTYSMVPKSQIGDQEALQLKNPLTCDLEYLKIDPIPNLLKVVEENKARFEEIKIFEMTNIYFPTEKGELPQEKMILAGIITVKDPWGRQFRPQGSRGFYEVKGIVEAIFDELNIEEYKFESIEKIPFYPPYDPDQAAAILPIKKIEPHKILGRLGRVQPSKGLNPQQGSTLKVWAFDLHIEALVRLLKPAKPYQPIPQFPPIIEDISLFVDRKTPVGNLANTIQKLSDCQTVKLTTELIDIYEDKKLRKEGKKSLTFRITYQAPDCSLSDKEVKPIREKIIKELEKNFRAKIRGDPLSS